ncbi:MAG: SWIM zinc finger family protein [Candidatus Dormibacteria bacterium]
MGELTIAPGEVSALVQGSRAKPYAVQLRVRQFTSGEWDRVLAAVAARAAHAAALLDGELDPAVVEQVNKAGIALLPDAGELGPKCSCPDWANPCKHAAAVCYLVADSMDADPFTILLLRGRTREQVLAGLRRVRAAGTAKAGSEAGHGARGSDPGVEARVAFAKDRSATPVALPPPPDHAGSPATLAMDPPADAGVTRDDLVALAADAARRAWELSRGTGDGGLGLTADADLARLAADRLGRGDFDEFARHVGVAPRRLMRLALAWKAGGAAALDVLDAPDWRPAPDAMEEGVAALRSLPGRASVRGSRVTHSGAAVQLRFGPDELWYLCVRRAGTWEIHDPPAADPAQLTHLIGPPRRPTTSAGKRRA